jgi:hypothetical protein
MGVLLNTYTTSSGEDPADPDEELPWEDDPDELERDEDDDPEELDRDELELLPLERLLEYDCPPPGRASTSSGAVSAAARTARTAIAPARAVMPPPLRPRAR